MGKGCSSSFPEAYCKIQGGDCGGSGGACVHVCGTGSGAWGVAHGADSIWTISDGVHTGFCLSSWENVTWDPLVYGLWGCEAET